LILDEAGYPPVLPFAPAFAEIMISLFYPLKNGKIGTHDLGLSGVSSRSS